MSVTYRYVWIKMTSWSNTVFMQNQTITEFMMNKFEELRKTNRRISLRMVAYKIGITPGRLSELIRGKRPLSEFYFEKISTGLGLNQDERQQLRSYISVTSRRFNSDRVLGVKSGHLMGGWEEYAILNLLRISNGNDDVKWIGERLGLTPEAVEQAITNLERMELVRHEERGLEIVHRRLITSYECANPESREYYRKHLEKAGQAMDLEVNSSYTGVTLTVNPQQIPVAERMIERFRGRILRLLQQGTQSEVYSLNIQMFPLSIPEKSSTTATGANLAESPRVELDKV
ncbi:TIGR02147 family protein [Bdellovibrio sp. SKB1291214]|uniref:TIGR02147 family protein n=1 Tax=Bdellovibrio sp. SKB1291214 TaxID=1732569 RepID=UPI001595B94A|nr:TIGR02147 family protein [Bdellovibrio sp. SKB1291214]UYL09046.1 TIGR02147 family protein [Bdellovibrio sp. SKB1291214]